MHCASSVALIFLIDVLYIGSGFFSHFLSLSAAASVGANAMFYFPFLAYNFRNPMEMVLKPYRQTSFSMRRDSKLPPLFYGPYQVLDHVGKVAYHLQLPPTVSIHPVFHVSMFKKMLGNHQLASSKLIPINAAGQFLVEPIQILNRHLIKRDKKPIPQTLVQWFNLPPKQATWEDLATILE
ncbi:hypothetical protein LguiB_004201 [Lonicera macranthoides]